MVTNRTAPHDWTPDVRNGQPILRCANPGCAIVWWPDRRQPKSACRGLTVRDLYAAMP